MTQDGQRKGPESAEGPPGQGRAGAALLAASVAGVALAPLALRRLGRGGNLLVAAGCGALFARVAAAAAAATFAVHAVREAIYLSPGHGSEEPAAQ